MRNRLDVVNTNRVWHLTEGEPMKDVMKWSREFWNRKFDLYMEKYDLIRYSLSPGRSAHEQLFFALKGKFGDKLALKTWSWTDDCNIICQLTDSYDTIANASVTIRVRPKNLKENAWDSSIKVTILPFPLSVPNTNSLIGLELPCHSGCVAGIEMFVEQVCKDFSSYYEELKLLSVEIPKEQKAHEIAVTSLRAYIPALMSQTNYEWNLVEEERRMLLQVKMKRNRMLEISLAHKSFMDKLPELLNVIVQFEQAIADSPYLVNIKNYGRDIAWKKGGG